MKDFLNQIFDDDRKYHREALKAALSQLIKPQVFDNACFPDKHAGVVHIGTGLGKTRNMFALAVYASVKIPEIDRVVVVAPNSNTIGSLLEREMQSFMVYTEGINNFPLERDIYNRNSDIDEGRFHVLKTEAAAKNRITALSDMEPEDQAKTLLIIDEAHHVFKRDKGKFTSFGEWLAESDFKYVMGYTGTPYNKNEKISEVVYEYNVLDGIVDRHVKSIHIANSEDSFRYAMERHNFVVSQYGLVVDPVCLFVYRNIKVATEAYGKFCAELEGFDFNKPTSVDNAILVHSKSDDESLKNFRNINEYNRLNPKKVIKFIFSVNMANEGWDCNNVFTIIPSESKAFNSKLLVAQVTGRGLRYDKKMFKSPPELHISDHSSFKNGLSFLHEVTGIDKQLKSFMTDSNNFDVVKLDLQPITHNVEVDAKDLDLQDIRKKLNDFSEGRFVEAENMVTGEKTSSTGIRYDDMLNYEQIKTEIIRVYGLNCPALDVLEPHHKIDRRDLMSLKGFINRYLNPVDKISVSKIVEYERDITVVSTKDMNSSYANPNRLIDSSVFYHGESSEQNLISLTYVDDTKKVKASSWNSPQDIVFVHDGVEKPFVDLLVGLDVIWIKSPDRGFYEIPYEVDGEPHVFNPDFLVKHSDITYIIETKPDGISLGKENNDSAAKIRAKVKAAEAHCETLRKQNHEYHFRLITPNDFMSFVHAIQNNSLMPKGIEHEKCLN